MTSADDGPRPDRLEAGAVIFEIGSEGGTLTGDQRRGWLAFRLAKGECGLSAQLDEEDCEGLVFTHESIGFNHLVCAEPHRSIPVAQTLLNAGAISAGR